MTEKKFIQIAERLGWSVTKDRYDIELQFYTDYGQDFSFSVNRNEDYVKQVYDYYNSFDPDEEALLWVDDSGHGKNGAPYRLKDIITDMEEVEKELEKLYDALISA
jgi:hypothetical protein